METVSLDDDAASINGNGNSAAYVSSSAMDHMEAQFTNSVKLDRHRADEPSPIPETDDEDEDDDEKRNSVPIIVVVDQKNSFANGDSKHTLPPLRGASGASSKPSVHFGQDMDEDDEDDDVAERDYVDTSLFSPEVSRHSIEVAHRRAKSLELELKEMAVLDKAIAGPATAAAAAAASSSKLSPGEAIGIIGSAFINSFSRVKHMIKPGGDTEYDLLSGSSPSGKLEDLDTDGDGLQISPDASKGDGKHFKHPSVRPALKRISAYASIESDKPLSRAKKPKKRIQWHEEVLDHDEEFYDDPFNSDEAKGAETESLMVNGNGAHTILNYKNDGRLTPQSKKKRKKLVTGVMRRLTPKEKEELYKLRPDLMIIPNWAQKYREEMTEADSTRWNFWLIFIISTLAILLVILLVLIAREHAQQSKA